MKSLKAKIRLEKGLKVIALFDTNTEINVIIKEVIKNAELAIK